MKTAVLQISTLTDAANLRVLNSLVIPLDVKRGKNEGAEDSGGSNTKKQNQANKASFKQKIERFNTQEMGGDDLMSLNGGNSKTYDTFDSFIDQNSSSLARNDKSLS